MDSLLRSGGARSSNIYSFQQSKPVTRYQKALPKPTRDNLDDICEILKTNIVPHKKMQVVNALKENKFGYISDLVVVFKDLEDKRNEERKLGIDD